MFEAINNFMKNKRLYNLDPIKLSILSFALASFLNKIINLRESMRIYSSEDLDFIQGLLIDESVAKGMLEELTRKTHESN